MLNSSHHVTILGSHMTTARKKKRKAIYLRFIVIHLSSPTSTHSLYTLSLSSHPSVDVSNCHTIASSISSVRCSSASFLFLEISADT